MAINSVLSAHCRLQRGGVKRVARDGGVLRWQIARLAGKKGEVQRRVFGGGGDNGAGERAGRADDKDVGHGASVVVMARIMNARARFD